MNANQKMTTNLLNHLSPSAVAAILNANKRFVKELIGHLDPKVIASTTNNTGPFMTGLYANLNADVIGAVVENNQSFMAELVTNLSPAIVAAGINQASNANPDFIPTLVSHLDGKVMGDTMKKIHNAAPGPTGHHENDFVGSVMAALSQPKNHGALDAIAKAVNANAPRREDLHTAVTFLGDFVGSTDPTILADVVNRAAANGFITPLVLGLQASTLADAMNAHPENTGALLSALDTSGGITAITQALNANPNLLPEVLGMLNPAVLAGVTQGGDNNVMKHFALKAQAMSMAYFVWTNLPVLIWTMNIADVPPAAWDH